MSTTAVATSSDFITDGDFRRTRHLHGLQELPAFTAAQMATPHPLAVPLEMLAAGVLALKEQNRQAISVLPVVDPAQPLRLLRLLRLHDLVQAGFSSSASAP
jgi:arabinose-5-phosphate isomerase